MKYPYFMATKSAAEQTVREYNSDGLCTVTDFGQKVSFEMGECLEEDCACWKSDGCNYSKNNN